MRAHPAGRQDLGDGAWFSLEEGFVADDAAAMAELLEELPLRQEQALVFGKVWPTPRLVSWHGDPGCTYRYSGRVFEPAPWSPALITMQQRLLGRVGVRFNTVLANYYRDGADAMGAHADDEPELGPRAPDDVLIASVSLGARRRFVLTRRQDRARRVLSLGQGSLLIMGGSTQRDFTHHVPRTQRTIGPRLNLTFRQRLIGRV